MTSPGVGGDVVVLWKEFGYRPFQDGWSENPAHRGAEDAAEGRWLPVAAYNALLARANTAKVLLKEARRYVEDNIAGRFVPSNGEAAALLSRLDAALGEG